MKLSEIAEIAEGVLFGDKDMDVEPKEIGFSLDRKRRDGAKVVLVSEKIERQPFILVKDPQLSFCKVLSAFSKDPSGIHPSAVIEEGAVIGEKSTVCANSYIASDVRIGKCCVIFPNCVIMHAKIGDRVRIHPGVVIGADGFGYIKRRENVKIPQVGDVVIEDDVEIGANTTIDRGTTGSTVIGAGTKIDNLVQIGHNVVVGRDCIIVAQVGISGSVEIGDNVVIGGQAGITEHVKIGKCVKIGAKSGVTKDIPEGMTVSGFPAKDHREEKRLTAFIHRLPQILEKIKEIEKKI
jgi:UDP-3-O-[3-hydroxymyristoyl] glucosamine N-acyltransferase